MECTIGNDDDEPRSATIQRAVRWLNDQDELADIHNQSAVIECRENSGTLSRRNIRTRGVLFLSDKSATSTVNLKRSQEVFIPSHGRANDRLYKVV